MTTPVEQVFLYGEADPEDIAPSGILALLGYADLTAGGAIVLALIVLTGLVIENWTDLEPWISAAVVHFIIPFARILTSGACSLATQLAAVRSVGELHVILLSNLHWIVKPIVARLLFFLAPLRWCCPPNRPLAIMVRLGGSCIMCATVYFNFLLPASRFLYGLCTGFMSASLEQTRYCLDTLLRFDLTGQPSQSLWLEACYCRGEVAGGEMRAVVENNWQLSRLLNRLVDGEIYHLYAIAFAITCVLFVIIAAWWSDALSWAASTWDTVAGRLVYGTTTKAQLRETHFIERESRLWDKINEYKGNLRSLKAALEAQAEELRIVKQKQDDGWAHAKKISTQHREVEASQRREADEKVELRAQLGRLSVQLGKAKEKQVDTAARARTLSEKVAMLEYQLAQSEERTQREEQTDKSSNETESLKAALDARNEQIADMERRLADSEAREDQFRGRHEQLLVEYQQLTARQDELAADNRRLAAAQDELQDRYDDLFFMSEPVAQINELEQERDCLKLQLASLQDEHTTMKQTAENYYQQTQESLSQAASREAGLQQSLSDLKSAYDMGLAQERSDAQEVRQRASDLAAEVADLQGKVGQAMRDAQRNHEEAESSNQTVKILEHRLAKYTLPQSCSDIPKRQIGDMGSISTALHESRVTISKQQTEINDLKRHLEQAKANGARPVESTLREEAIKLRRALDTERRARTEDQIRWDKRTRELEEENRKLTIARSNAAAACGGGMRKSSR